MGHKWGWHTYLPYSCVDILTHRERYKGKLLQLLPFYTIFSVYTSTFTFEMIVWTKSGPITCCFPLENLKFLPRLVPDSHEMHFVDTSQMHLLPFRSCNHPTHEKAIALNQVLTCVCLVQNYYELNFHFFWSFSLKIHSTKKKCLCHRIKRQEHTSLYPICESISFSIWTFESEK